MKPITHPLAIAYLHAAAEVQAARSIRADAANHRGSLSPEYDRAHDHCCATEDAAAKAGYAWNLAGRPFYADGFTP